MNRLLLLLVLLLPLSGRAQNISSTTCTATTSTGCVSLPLYLYSNINSVVVQVTGVWAGELIAEGSNDGASFVQLRTIPVGGGIAPGTLTTNGIWSVPTAGLLHLRIRATAWTSGVATVVAQPSVTDALASGNTQVSGTVELGSVTAAAIAAPVCSLSPTPPIVTLTTTPQTVPATPLANRTQLVVRNLSTVQLVWCCVGTGCTPTATSAYVVLPSGGYLDLPVRSTNVVRCRTALGTADVNLLESSCG